MRKFLVTIFTLSIVLGTIGGVGALMAATRGTAPPAKAKVSLPEAPVAPAFTPEHSGDLAEFFTWRDEVRAQAQSLDSKATAKRDKAFAANAAAEKAAVKEATTDAANVRLKADAKERSKVLVDAKAAAKKAESLEEIRAAIDQATAKRDKAFAANAAAEKAAVKEATTDAANVRLKADAKAKNDHLVTKGEIAAEFDRVTTLADSDLQAADKLFGNDAEQQVQIYRLQERITELETAPPAPVATACTISPSYTG